MKLIEMAKSKVKDIAQTVNWSIVIALITAGISAGILVAIIFLYLFAAGAHVAAAFNDIRVFLRLA